MPAAWETGVVLGVNVALALFAWIAIRLYADSIAPKAPVPVPREPETEATHTEPRS